MYRYIDTFDDFMRYWSDACSKPEEQKLELWETSYMGNYAELLEKQVAAYEEQDFSWRGTAREKVFSRLADLLPLMEQASQNLPDVCRSTYELAVQALQIDFPIVFVAYVGIGCGAGWATRYQGYPACLLGLEKIAELGWHSPESLSELVSHEIGHLAHMHWRGEFQEFARHEEDPLFLLYSEGFAKRCEYLILGSEGWNQAHSKDWLSWCREHKRWLAAEYLHRVDSKKPVKDFFADWLHIQGQRETGYFLGQELILSLQGHYDVREIAELSLETVKKEARRHLCALARGAA